MHSTSRYLLLLFLVCSPLCADYLPKARPNPIDSNRIANSPIHTAILEAHETQDFTILSWCLDHFPDSFTKLTDPVNIVERLSYDNPRKDFDNHYDWQEGITALEYAIRLGDTNIVKLLLDAGADATITRNEHFATYVEHWFPKPASPALNEVAHLLPHMPAKKPFKYNMLYLAIALEHTEIVDLLLEFGANPSEILLKYDYNKGLSVQAVYSASQLGTVVDPELEVHMGSFSTTPGIHHIAIRSVEEDEGATVITLSNNWVLQFLAPVSPDDIEVGTLLKLNLDSETPSFPLNFPINIQAKTYTVTGHAFQSALKSKLFFVVLSE